VLVPLARGDRSDVNLDVSSPRPRGGRHVAVSRGPEPRQTVADVDLKDRPLGVVLTPGGEEVRAVRHDGHLGDAWLRDGNRGPSRCRNRAWYERNNTPPGDCRTRRCG